MNLYSFPLALALAAFACTAAAAPGAHGPNGEHLDGPATMSAAAGSEPRLESFSETFELVARLQPNALVLELVRYASNEPVAHAKIDVGSGAAKAQAVFDAASGSYRVSDAALLQLLRAPGTHALMFTVSAGADGDLLEGKLHVAGASHHAASQLPSSTWPMAASAAFVGGLALFARRRSKGRRA
jgi:hypothetical protein